MCRLQQLLDQTTQKLKELKEKHNIEQQVSVDCPLHSLSSCLLFLQNVVELTTIVNQQKMQIQTLQERLNDLKMSNEKVYMRIIEL